jgi:DNA-binding LacI/PurR family transcriptional regulator
MNKTVKDVAVEAGVSPSTISRVFRGSKLVNSETKQRVMEASRKCGYFPHSAARAMRGGKFNRVACVMTRYGDIGQAHSNFSGYLDIAADFLAQRGYSVIFEPFHLIPITNDFVEAPRIFSELAVDGILGFDTVGVVPDEIDERIREMKAPVVWVNRNPRPGINCVNCDDVANTRILVRYLLELGHRRIGFYGIEELSGVKEPHYSLTERFETVREELRSAGLDTSGMNLMRADSPGLEYAMGLLDTRPAYTAIICFNFRLQYFMMCAAAARGLVIPRDLSLAYFISQSEITTFKAGLGTGVVVPEASMVQRSVDLLLDEIEGKNGNPEIIRVSGELYKGLSTAPPRKDG